MPQVSGLAAAGTDKTAAAGRNAFHVQLAFFTGGNPGENIHQPVVFQESGRLVQHRHHGHQHDDVVIAVRREIVQGLFEFLRGHFAGIQGFEFDAAGLDGVGQQALDVFNAGVVHVADDDPRGTVRGFHRHLGVHLSHGSGAAGKPAGAAAFQRGAEIASVCGGKIAAFRALIIPAFIVDAADVERPFFIAVLPDETDHGAARTELAELFAELAVADVAKENIVKRFALGHRIDHRHGLAEFGGEFFRGGGAQVQNLDCGGSGILQQFAGFVSKAIAGSARDQYAAAGFRLIAVFDHIGGLNAGPGLHQRGDGGGRIRIQRQEVAAFVAVEHALVDHAVFGHAAVDGVAIGESLAAHVNIGLNDEALAGFEFRIDL